MARRTIPPLGPSNLVQRSPFICAPHQHRCDRIASAAFYSFLILGLGFALGAMFL